MDKVITKTISKDCIETAYCFLHQKWRIYQYSTLEWQKDDIEQAIADYSECMDKKLYCCIAAERPEFLRSHRSFEEDINLAVNKLENILKQRENEKES